MLDSNQRFPAPKAGGMNQTILISVVLVVIEGIDPSSSAYETATHPSTSYHQYQIVGHFRLFKGE